VRKKKRPGLAARSLSRRTHDDEVPQTARPSGGVVAAAVVALSATPAGATVVCPPGVKPPSKYCTNVKPTAITQTASNVKATSGDAQRRRGRRQRAGTFSKKIRAPRKRGTYTLEVRAKPSCGSQSVKKRLKVH
jgi:hypothetical protein